MKKEFNPFEWLKEEKKPETTIYRSTISQYLDNDESRIQKLILKIESSHIDITQGYENWRNIGFSLAESIGESGRNYFHRISRFNPDYNREKCDRQYTKCLNCKGGGITLATLFWIAKTNGVTLKN